VRRDSTESKVRADESANVPLDVAKVRRPSVRPETESAVVEALVAVRRAFAESKVNADESVSCPAVVAKGTRPEVRDEIRMFVVLADVKYPFVAVNAVDDAYGNVLEIVAVEVIAPAILSAPPKVLVPVVVKSPTTVELACETNPLPNVPRPERVEAPVTARVELNVAAPDAVSVPTLAACAKRLVEVAVPK